MKRTRSKLVGFSLAGLAVATICFGSDLASAALLAGNLGGRVVSIESLTCQQELLAGSLGDPIGLALESPGIVLVADANWPDGQGSVSRLNLATRSMTILSAGGQFLDPLGVAVATDGTIYVLDGSGRKVFRIDSVTGAQTPISVGGMLRNPESMQMLPDGELLVVDADAYGGPGGLIRINPQSGIQTPVSGGGLFVDPIAAYLEPNGSFLVTDLNAPNDYGSVIRVAQDGGQSIVATGSASLLQDPEGIARDTDGQVYVIGQNAQNYGGGGLLLRLDPVTGALTVVCSGGMLGFAPTLLSVPELPTPSHVTTWGQVKDRYRK